jgi:anaerobic ribonucleoside-triphosphate reductase activating protein
MNKLKYLGYSIVFQEVPDEVTLAINISGCPHKCEGCHSKHLWEYKGNYVSDDLPELLKKYEGMITCVCFMGGDQNLEELNHLVCLVKEAGLKAALYTGSSDIGCIVYSILLDYVKYGPYIEECGGLDKKTTNQVMLKWEKDKWIDITYKFQKGHKNGKI